MASLIFFHEVISDDAISYQRGRKRILTYRYYHRATDKKYHVHIRMRESAIKMECVSIEIDGIIEIRHWYDLDDFYYYLLQILPLWHRYDSYEWAPRLQIPRHLTRDVFNLAYSIYVNKENIKQLVQQRLDRIAAELAATKKH